MQATQQDLPLRGSVTVALAGEPVPYHHSSTRGGKRYMPARPRNSAATLRLKAEQVMAGAAPLQGPLRLELYCEVPIPQSWSRKKQNSARLGLFKPTGRPDLTNYLKLIEDAMKHVVFADDSQVVDQTCCKRYGERPRLVVTVTPL